MSTLSASVSLIVKVEEGQNIHYCRVSADFPGIYENNEVLSNIEIITTPDSNGNYPVNIQYLTNTNKISESGTTNIEDDFQLEALPLGVVEEDFIDIIVSLTDEDETTIEGGGVISQSEPSGDSKPGGF